MFEKRENEKLEFKKSTSELKQAIISLSSMLNKNNYGVLYFGVNNEGEIVGQQIGKDTTKDIFVQIKNNIRPVINPSINIIEVGSKQIIKVEVYGDDTPYSAYGRYYIRSDDEDLLMTNSQLENFFINKNIDYSKYKQGAKVKHAKFGIGTIRSIFGSGPSMIAEVVFPDFGLKKLAVKFTPMEIYNG